MIAGSYYGFLLNAGHVCQTSRDFFLHVHTWNCTRGKPCGDRMDLWAFMTIRVSLRYRYDIALGLKDTINGTRYVSGCSVPTFFAQLFARKHKWTNCISRYCKVSLLVVHHIAFHSLEPLSRQKSTSHKDSFINTFADFSSEHFETSKHHLVLWGCGTVALAHTAKVPCLPGSQQCF